MKNSAAAQADFQVIRSENPQRGKGFVRVKRLVQTGFFLLAIPRLVVYRICRALMGRRAFSAASESIARVPGVRGIYLRQAFYRKTLDACGQDVYFGWLSVFSSPEARIAEGVYIGRYCTIGFAEIGEGALLADGVQVLSGGHQHQHAKQSSAEAFDSTQTFRKVKIGRGAWLGAGAIVMADIGEGAIVGAGAVVTKPIPDRVIAAGVPAIVVKSVPTEPNPPDPQKQ